MKPEQIKGHLYAIKVFAIAITATAFLYFAVTSPLPYVGIVVLSAIGTYIIGSLYYLLYQIGKMK